jgi:hypothetical protein
MEDHMLRETRPFRRPLELPERRSVGEAPPAGMEYVGTAELTPGPAGFDQRPQLGIVDRNPAGFLVLGSRQL